MKSLAVVCALASCVVGACGNRSGEALPPDVTRAYEDALATDNPDTVAELFTKDAEILAQERGVVKGQENIRQYLADQASPVIMFDTTTDMSLVRDDLAFETGSYIFRDTRRGADIEFGKYMHVWRKEGDRWKLFRAMYNADEPVNAQVTVAHETE